MKLIFINDNLKQISTKKWDNFLDVWSWEVAYVDFDILLFSFVIDSEVEDEVWMRQSDERQKFLFDAQHLQQSN